MNKCKDCLEFKVFKWATQHEKGFCYQNSHGVKTPTVVDGTSTCRHFDKKEKK